MESDLFALGSTLYELVAGQKPYEGMSDESTESLFEEGKFPSTEGLLFGDIITGCWKRKFLSAEDILAYGKNVFESKETNEAYETG